MLLMNLGSSHDLIQELPGSWANVEITTPPATRPVSLAELRAFARVPPEEPDTLLELFIDAAVDWVRRQGVYLIRTEIRQTFTPIWFSVGYDALRILGNPVISIGDVELRQSDGTYQTIAPAQYQEREIHGSTYLIFDVNLVNSSSDVRVDINRIRVSSVMGFGGAVGDVPSDVRVGLLNYAAVMYDYRNDDIQAPVVLQSALSPYRSFYGA